MKKYVTLALLAILTGVAWAAINERGTAGAPVSVSTVTKVLSASISRRSWCILPETVDIRCMVGGGDDAAASPAPSTTVGFLFKAGAMSCDTSGFNANVPASIVPRLRLDCASTAGATNVSTWTE